MTPTSLHLVIHNEAVVQAQGLPPVAAQALASLYPQFVTDASALVPDLTLHPLPGDVPMPARAQQMQIYFGFVIGDWRGEPAIQGFRKGRADLIIPLAPPMRIFFRPVDGIQRRLQWALSFCLWWFFSHKKLLLLHGAFLEKDGKRILLAGHRGSKKTLLTLAMLHQGWDFLTDDKALIRQQIALPFAPPVLTLHNHHLAVLPWLRQRLPKGMSVDRWAGLRAMARTLVLHHLPARLHAAMDRIANPHVHLPVTTLFPECRILRESRPDKAIILMPGKRFSLEPLSREEGRRCLALVATLAYEEFSTLARMVALYHPAWESPEFQELLDVQMPTDQFLLARIPEDADVEQAMEAFARC